MQENNDSLDNRKAPHLIGNDEPSIPELSLELEKAHQENEKLRSELHEEKAKRTVTLPDPSY